MKYTLKTCYGKYIVGDIRDVNQAKEHAIITSVLPWIVICRFKLDGIFIGCDTYSIAGDVMPYMVKSGAYILGMKGNDVVWAKMNAVAVKMSIVQCPIQILEFEHEKHGISLHKYSKEMSEYCNNPNTISDDDRTDLENEKNEWDMHGACVLTIGDEIWLDKNGNVLAT